MALKPAQEEEDEYTMAVERKNQLMVPPTGNGIPTLKNAHFLKPLLDPSNQTLPKLPSFSVSSNPNIFRITSRVHFKGRPITLKAWKTWVENLQQTHQNFWIKLGIFDAIRTSTYQIKRHNELIIGLADKWCPETNSFIFPWGESTVTLEDVMILGGFSVLGVSVLNLPQSNREFEEIESKLVDACREVRRVFCCASHYGWMNHFKGKGGDLEHVALLVLWLSRYVFSTNSYGLINPKVFGIAISLVKGVKVALAYAVLAAIYRDLRLLKEKIVTFIGGRGCRSDLVLWAPFQIVQLWFWERFPKLSPRPTSLIPSEPRLARWHKIDKLPIRSLMHEIESAGHSFVWRPYALPLENWECPRFYCDNERWVCINSEVDDILLSFARCLKAGELVGMDCLEQYLPHRIGMQFGMDQDIPGSPPRSSGNSDPAWISYMPLDGWKLYLPPRAINGEVTMRYYNWRKVALFGHDKLNKMKGLSHNFDENLEGEDEIAPPCSKQMGTCTLQSELTVEGDMVKAKPIALEEDHQMIQESGSNTFVRSNNRHSESESNNNSEDRLLHAGNEVGEASANDLVVITDDDDENNDSTSEFLAYVSGIEGRIKSLRNTFLMLKKQCM